MVGVVVPCLSRRPVLRNLRALRLLFSQTAMECHGKGDGNACRSPVPGSGSMFPPGSKAKKERIRERL